jgi:hypothetical protein
MIWGSRMDYKYVVGWGFVLVISPRIDESSFVEVIRQGWRKAIVSNDNLLPVTKEEWKMLGSVRGREGGYCLGWRPEMREGDIDAFCGMG